MMLYQWLNVCKYIIVAFYYFFLNINSRWFCALRLFVYLRVHCRMYIFMYECGAVLAEIQNE